MRKLLFVISLMIALIPLTGQSLFESAQDESPSSPDLINMLGGYVRSSMYIGNSGEDESAYFQSLYGLLGLTTDLELGQYGSAFADLRFRYGNEFQKDVSEMELREAYTVLYAGPVDLKMGKQIVSWGSSSFFNPSDRFSARNPVYRSPDPDDLRIGAWSVNARLNIAGSSSLQLLWLPLYQASILITEPFEFPEYIKFSEPEWPSPEIKESSYGLLYDLRSSLLDVSLSFYNGYRNDPKFTIQSATFDPLTFAPQRMDLRQEAFRINAAGVNMSVPLGSYIFRTEAAWTSPVDEADELVYLPMSELSYIGEIEQNGANINLIAGYYGKYILSFEAPAADAASLTGEFPDLATLLPEGVVPTQEIIDGIMADHIGAFNQLYDYQMQEFYHSIYASVSVFLLNDALKLELPVVYNFTTSELVLRPVVEYSITDGMILQAGYSYMSGEEDSLYDLVGPTLNSAWLSVKVMF